MWLTLGNKSAKARSILGILELGATHGANLLVGAQGPDAVEAIDALAALFESGRCGESTLHVSARGTRD